MKKKISHYLTFIFTIVVLSSCSFLSFSKENQKGFDEQRSTLKGSVTDYNDLPISGAKLVIGEDTTYTDSKGNYFFQTFDNREDILNLFPDNRSNTKYYFSFKKDSLLTFDIIFRSYDNEDFTKGNIRGYVKDENGEPLAGAKVFLEGTPWGVELDEDGYYNITGVRTGIYTLKCIFIDYREAAAEIKIKSNLTQNLDINMIPDDYILKEVEFKPVLYLYPEDKTDINVSIDHIGNLIHCYPCYSEKGWSVTGMPDGTLHDKRDNKEYYCLYWEAERNYDYDIKSGFIVEGKDTREFLEEKLEVLGLNRREANEFIIYWLPIMENNRYNLVHFSTDKYQSISKLHIDPKPDTLIRVHMVLQKLDEPVEIEEQMLSPIKRSGYTAVEWGGTIQK